MLCYSLFMTFDLRVNETFLYFVFLLSYIASYILAFTKIRMPVLIIAYVVLFVIIDFGAYNIIHILQDSSAGDTYDFSYFYFENHFYYALAFFTVGYLSNLLFFRWKRFFLLEMAFQIFVLIQVFYAHRDYQLSQIHWFSVFNYFAAFVLVVVLFVFVTLFLKEHTQIFGLANRKQIENARKIRLGGIIGIILLIIIGVTSSYFVSKSYLAASAKGAGGLISQSSLDFEEYLNLFPSVHQNFDPIMIANMSELRHIRRTVLSGYKDGKGKGFYFDRKNPYEKDFPYKSEDNFYEIPKDPDYVGRYEMKQRYFIFRQKFDEESLLGVNYATRIYPVKNIDPVKYSTTFNSISKVFDTNYYYDLNYVDYSNTPKDFMEYYTKGTSSKRINELAQKIVEETGAENTFQKVYSILKYLEENYEYSLKPGGEDVEDRLEYFLFESKKGYCTYYAFAFALLARSLDIPSRVAAGFLPDPLLEVMNYYYILGSRAHTWVEIYFEEFGWITFDVPTGSEEEMEEGQMGDPLDWNKFLDAIRQIERNPEVEKEIEEEIEKYKEQKEQQKQTIQQRINKSIAFILIIIIIVIFVILIIKLIRFLLIKQDDDELRIINTYNFVRGLLFDVGLGRKPHEVLNDFAKRINEQKSIEISGLTDLYLKAKYDKQIPENAKERVEKSYQEFITSYKKNIPLYKRIISWINIKSFFKK